MNRARSPLGRTPWVLLILLLAGLGASLALNQLLSADRSEVFTRPVGASVFDTTQALGPLGPLADMSSSPRRWARGEPSSVGIALVDIGEDTTDHAAEVVEVLDRYEATGSWFLSGRTIADRSSRRPATSTASTVRRSRRPARPATA